MVPVLDVEGLEVSPVADDVGVKNEELIAAGPAMKRGARKSFPKERRSSVTYDARIKMNITNRESHHILVANSFACRKLQTANCFFNEKLAN